MINFITEVPCGRGASPFRRIRMKTIKEINDKIKKKKALVLTAEEIIDFVKKKGAKRTAEEVDVVTTGTFVFQCGPHKAEN